ncbi:putative protein kinase RLK-Pelle-RLCK-VIIa-2 family [Helianthus annuus]|nr:putative protein kinase RLK-Pelle-RLCK-VIIa-2 family [Helianthus annuus]
MQNYYRVGYSLEAASLFLRGRGKAVYILPSSDPTFALLLVGFTEYDDDDLSVVDFAGTVKYAAPEYIETGRVSSKSDVWSYGVNLDGNRPQNEQKLLEWVKIYLDTKRFTLIIDSRLKGKYSLDSAQKLSLIANCCLSRDPKSRPTMSEVLEMVNQLITEVDIMPTQLLKSQENTKHKDENNQLGMSPWKLLKSCFKKECRCAS